MTKKDIVRSIAEELGMSQLLAHEIVQRTFAAIVETLVQEGRVELRNFGVFQIKKRERRLARNPRTGQSVVVPARSVITFKPGKRMQDRVSEGADRSEPQGPDRASQ